MQFQSSDWLSHHGIWAIIPCPPNMVTVLVCSKLKTSSKSVFSQIKSTLLAQQCWELPRLCWLCCANECTKFQQYWDLQWILGRIQPIRLWRPCVMRVWPQQCWKDLKEALCKWIQHYCATLRRSRDKSRYLKSLTVFKLCATTPRVQKDATMLRPFARG